MIKQRKNSRPLKWTWSGTRFVREKTGEVEFENKHLSLRYKRARYYSAQLGRFISRDPLGFVDGMSLYRAYFVPGGMDPTGNVCVECNCRCSESGYVLSNGGGTRSTVKVECSGSGEACCKSACKSSGSPGTGSVPWIGKPPVHCVSDKWKVCGTGPDSPGPEDTCPDDWWNGDYLTCTACCVKSYKFWTSIEAATACGGARIPKPHVKPEQYPCQSILYGPRRCLPKCCRPTLVTTRTCGRRLGYLFIAEGCYDAGVSVTCASYCAAR